MLLVVHTALYLVRESRFSLRRQQDGNEEVWGAESRFSFRRQKDGNEEVCGAELDCVLCVDFCRFWPEPAFFI